MRQAYRLLLRLYPPEYQSQFAREMLAVYSQAAEERRTRGRIRYAFFVAGECAGLIVGALGERSALCLAPVLGGITLAAGLHAGFYTASFKILQGTVAAVERTPLSLPEQREAAITLGVYTVAILVSLLPIFFLLSIRLFRRVR